MKWGGEPAELACVLALTDVEIGEVGRLVEARRRALVAREAAELLACACSKKVIVKKYYYSV